MKPNVFVLQVSKNTICPLCTLKNIARKKEQWFAFFPASGVLLDDALKIIYRSNYRFDDKRQIIDVAGDDDDGDYKGGVFF